MKKERIIEEMVKMDAWFLDLCENYKDPWNNPHVVSKPNYLHDLNAVQRVLLGLTQEQQSDFCMYATEHGTIDGTQIAFDRPASWCEAILKATGKWED